MHSELQDSCTIFWTQIWVVYFLWILPNFSLKRSILVPPLHINACTVTEDPRVQTSTEKHKPLISSIYYNVKRWSVVQKQFSEWINEADVSLNKIQTILLLILIHKGLFTHNFVTVIILWHLTKAFNKVSRKTFYITINRTTATQDSNLTALIQQPLNFPLYNLLLHG